MNNYLLLDIFKYLLDAQDVKNIKYKNYQTIINTLINEY